MKPTRQNLPGAATTALEDGTSPLTPTPDLAEQLSLSIINPGEVTRHLDAAVVESLRQIRKIDVSRNIQVIQLTDPRRHIAPGVRQRFQINHVHIPPKFNIVISKKTITVKIVSLLIDLLQDQNC